MMLSNMHTNTNAAHNYSNQHPFALNISSSSAAQFVNQNPEQAPPSNHPVTNPAVGQNYTIQKSNNATPLPPNQTHPLTPVQPVANVAPQIAELTLPEKSQANGTSEGEPSHLPFSQSAFSLIPKEKLPVAISAPSQVMEREMHSIQENIIQISSLTIPSKVDNNDAVTPSKIPEISPAKSVQEAPTLKEADSPITSSAAAQSECDQASAKPVAVPEREQDPLHIPEKEKSKTPERISTIEQKAEVAKPEDPKESDLLNKVGASTTDAVKSKSLINEPVKKEHPVQKEVSDVKAVKSTPRKAKTVLAEHQQTPAATSTPSASSSTSNTAKRQRIRTQHYQSPLPEVEFVSKISSTSLKSNDEKLIVFYKNEFLAVRNAEGGFYLCQAIQNIYKSSPKIKIRWLSQDKGNNEQGEVYTPDFYDLIDFDCILTNLSLLKADKGKFILPLSEKNRTESILNRSIAVEKGEEISSPSLTEEHPDGLDLSLYRDEDQLKKRKSRKRSRKAPSVAAPKEAPTKKSPKAPKVRKVAPPAKASSSKKAAPKKPAPPVKRAAPPAEPKPAPSAAKPSKATGKATNKTTNKPSPVVDQKKAKVLATIGKKAAVAVAAKSAKNNSKNGKSGNRAVAPSNKTVQPKANSHGSVRATTARSVRKSSRK